MRQNRRAVPYQYEPLVTPGGWHGSELQFAIRLTQIVDDLYQKYGALRQKTKNVEPSTPTDEPVDADTLNGKTADDFLAVDGTAVNAEKLGGKVPEEFMPADAARMYRDLLWQNASSTSEFAAQKISVDLSAYSRVGIDFRYNNDEDGFYYGEFGVGVNGFVNATQLSMTADVMYLACRGGYARTTEVEFWNCYRYPSYNAMGNNELKNKLLVPWRIYGIREV